MEKNRFGAKLKRRFDARNYRNELIRLIRLMPEEDLYITEQPRTQVTFSSGVDLPFYGSNLPKYGSFGF